MKWFNKMDGRTAKRQMVIFLWIGLCNLIVQCFHDALHDLGIASWTIFLANVLFFIMENPNRKERFLQSICGGIFGLLCAAGMVWASGALRGLGLPGLVATLIPLLVALFLLLFFHPVFPFVCNNIGLAFFMVALINSQTACTHLVGNIVGVLLGNGIVNVGLILLVTWFEKRQKVHQ